MAGMAAPKTIARVGREIRAAVRGLLDQSQPFGRLALVHTVQAAGATFVAVSLAGSLFFSISASAAEGKVLLYLLLTIAPFALVGPALSPLLDRGAEARRTSVAIANIGSAVLCLLMARDVHGLLLFPEAFGVLVLGKLYLVARAALVPEMAAAGDDLASANAKLAVLASLAGFATAPLAVGFLKIGPQWALLLGALVFLFGTVVSLRLPRPSHRVAVAAPAPEAGGSEENPRLALARYAEVRQHRSLLGLPLYPPEVLAAIGAMSIARATVGFVEFFLAFGLRRAHAATWWFGVLLVASGAGSLLGSLVVPRLRRHLTERQIIIGALASIVVGSVATAIVGGLWAQVMLTFVVGIGPTSAKPALDSIVQRNVPPALLGRAFGRLETRLQLTWVLAAVLAVVVPFPLKLGDVVVALAAVGACISYATFGGSMRRQLARQGLRRPTEIA
jgi:Na+/melibiose symporter-like transporter